MSAFCRLSTVNEAALSPPRLEPGDMRLERQVEHSLSTPRRAVVAVGVTALLLVSLGALEEMVAFHLIQPAAQ